jgi:signal transduction histidine kinase/CheY-like chemotaxis protein
MSVIDTIPRDIDDSKHSDAGKNGSDDRSVSSRVTFVTQTLRNAAHVTFIDKRNLSIPFLIMLLGAAAAAAFLAVGIAGANADQDARFMNQATDVIHEISLSWKDFVEAGMWTHQECRDNISRTEFREIYENLEAVNLPLQALEWVPNITHSERASFEAEAAAWYSHYDPDYEYHGIIGFEPIDPNDPESGQAIQNRSIQPFYFAAKYVEPLNSNEATFEFDLASSPERLQSIKLALQNWQPVVTPRLHLVQDAGVDNGYSVLLIHPGIPVSTQPELKPRDVAILTLRISDVLKRATRTLALPFKVYMYDTTLPGQADFLGALTVYGYGNGNATSLPELGLNQVLSTSDHRYVQIENVTTSKWTIVVASFDNTFQPIPIFVILGGVLIFLGSIFLVMWVYTHLQRQAKFQRVKQQGEAEKAAILMEGMEKAARNERDLNDFIAHEVRNPLAAAMSACSFVSSAVNDETIPFTQARDAINEDLSIIDSALAFINDLLRNMLDMHRAKSKQLTIEWAPVDLLEDVLKPVDAMLYRRGGDVRVETICPPNLVILSDRLRLKQIVLNLARNSVKFVEKGFIRLTAAVMLDGTVTLFIEDSGPGIPIEKQRKLFAKFQDSLDALNQGTGIGLSLCLSLTELMGGTIALDDMYDSGVPGCPGSRFVIHLKKHPITIDDTTLENFSSGEGVGRSLMKDVSMLSFDENRVLGKEATLPATLTVLFVDDDMVLRKLFTRSLRRICPDWNIHEASNGESALVMVQEDVNKFQLIFVDQYMASVEKQLLGTETVRALRASGCTARICGLSANDIQTAFEDAGANAFMFKPFPTKADTMKHELIRILDGYEDNDAFDISSKEGLDQLEEYPADRIGMSSEANRSGDASTTFTSNGFGPTN